MHIHINVIVEDYNLPGIDVFGLMLVISPYFLQIMNAVLAEASLVSLRKISFSLNFGIWGKSFKK